MSVLRLGVVGYCPPTEFDEQDANELLAKAFKDVLADHPGATDIWVVSGLCDVGIPALAYRIAKEKGWKTSGIACRQANAKVDDGKGGLKNKFQWFEVDNYKIVGDNWGDESETFLKEIDVLIRVGGGKQSLAEVERFRRSGGRVYEYELAALPS